MERPNLKRKHDLIGDGKAICCICATNPLLKKHFVNSILYEKTLEFHPRIFGPHECLAYEEGVDLGSTQPRNILGRKNAALRDYDARFGNEGAQTEGRIQARLEAAQVATVDADQRRSELECEVKFW